jgi:hypothetical protein
MDARQVYQALRPLIDEALQRAGGGGGRTQLLTATFTLAELKAAGAVGAAFFTVGTLPAGARIVNPIPELVVNQAFAGPGFTQVIAELQGNESDEGEMGELDPVTNVAGTYAFTGGSNPYMSRGGQTISLEILPSIDFNTLTAGSVTVNLLYTVP